MKRTNLTQLAVPIGVVGVVMLLVVPLPAAMLDVLIVTNIALSLVVLLTSMYVRKPLDFSVFPSMLLVLTLFRLGLNVASTRLVLRDGFAGHVIDAFGHIVVSGSLVIGLVIFLILVVIQFAVITNGAGRVAEVGARFTLDAMPGKQMAIDADLNSGLIDEDEARRRRKEVAAEADFYGAMDGGSKFVKGDAIAGIIITVINLLGGFADRHAADGHVRRRRDQPVQPADHRRRPGHPDPGAADVGLHRPDRHEGHRRGGHGNCRERAADPVSNRAADRGQRGDRARAGARHAQAAVRAGGRRAAARGSADQGEQGPRRQRRPSWQRQRSPRRAPRTARRS